LGSERENPGGSHKQCPPSSESDFRHQRPGEDALHDWIKGKLNAESFIGFLERLLKNQDKPVFLIVGGHPVHRSARVRTFIESTEGKHKLFYLPPYSPELNPDEQVQNQLKNHRMGKMILKSLDDMTDKVHSAMRAIQRSPSLIRSLFRHKNCPYAAL